MGFTCVQKRLLSEMNLSRRQFLKLMGTAAKAAMGSPFDTASKAISNFSNLGKIATLPKISKESLNIISELLFDGIGNHFNQKYQYHFPPGVITFKGDDNDSYWPMGFRDFIRNNFPPVSSAEDIQRIHDYNDYVAKSRQEFINQYGAEHADAMGHDFWMSPVVEAYKATPQLIGQIIQQMPLSSIAGWFFLGEGNASATEQWIGPMFKDILRKKINSNNVNDLISTIVNSEFGAWGKDGLAEAFKFIPEVKNFFDPLNIKSANDYAQMLDQNPGELLEFLKENGVNPEYLERDIQEIKRQMEDDPPKEPEASDSPKEPEASDPINPNKKVKKRSFQSMRHPIFPMNYGPKSDVPEMEL